ncbi:alcohol dehydrogenase catalytic domain-containing protein [Enterococcus pingfangensis]
MTDGTIQGHELSGIVEAIGEAVSDLRIGDRVVIDPEIVCGKCKNRQYGKTSICLDTQKIGKDTHGGLAEYVIVPGENCLVLPESSAIIAGTLAFPALMILESVNRAFFKKNGKIVILGSDWLSLLVYYLLDHLHEGKIQLAVDLKNSAKLPSFVEDATKLDKLTT